MMDKYLSRKFVFAVVAAIVATVAMWLGKISGEAWVAAISTLGGSYFFANSYQHRGGPRPPMGGDA